MAGHERKTKHKLRNARRFNSPWRDTEDARARIAPDASALISAVGDRIVSELSELDVARMRRFVLDQVYSARWCRKQARLAWVALEEIVDEMVKSEFSEVGTRLKPLVRRSMPVGTAYAAPFESDEVEGKCRIGWTNRSDTEIEILTSERRIMSAYATRGDWEAIQAMCEPYRLADDIYEVTALMPFACGWVLPAAVHDRAWWTRSVPGMRLLTELASELQQRVFVNLSVEDILNGTMAVAQWMKRQVPADADDLDLDLDPEFLSLDEILSIHAEQLERFGGSAGVRDQRGLESAVIGQPQAVFSFLAGADLYDIAATYAFHISEGQPFLDGNKRTALNAALLFLAMNGAALPRDDAGQLYVTMMAVANGRMTRGGLADVLRDLAQ